MVYCCCHYEDSLKISAVTRGECPTVCAAASNLPSAACSSRYSFKFRASSIAIGIAFVHTIAATPVEEFCSSPTVTFQLYLAYTEHVGWTAILYIAVGSMCWINDITNSGLTSSSSFLFVASVSSPDNSSAAWLLIPAMCKISRSNSDKQSLYLASRPVKLARLRIHLRVALSTGIVNFSLSSQEEKGPYYS